MTDNDRMVLKEIAVIMEEANQKIGEKVASLSSEFEDFLDDYRQLEDAEDAQSVEAVITISNNQYSVKNNLLGDFIAGFRRIVEYYPER